MNDRVPVTELAVAATHAHELFISLIDAGFTEAQALELVKAAIEGARRGGKS